MEKRVSRTLQNLAVAALVVMVSPIQAIAGKVALVIGNSAYEHTVPLANPRNDAEAVAGKLRTLGFETIEGFDMTATEMARAAREFARAVRSADIALFYYAGHGIQVDGQNYLIPVDARMDDELSIDFEAFAIDVITKQMSYSSGANLLILDACRDNPFEEKLSRSMAGGTRSIGGGGLSEMKVKDNGTGTGIVFATEPGNVAQDGDGKHSPFTEAFLEHVGTPNTPITTIMSRVTGDVYRATDQSQRPWFNQSYTDEVVLYRSAMASEPVAAATPSQTAPAGTTGTTGDLEEEKYIFELARESGAIEDYQAYLDFYPDGRYARFARIAIERLKTEDQQVAALDVPSTPNASRSVASTYDPTAPLILPVTDALRISPATQTTEQSLQMDKAKRREIQARLNATGNDVGRPDGSFGPKTRRGVASWQTANGLPPTQFLNGLQLSLLVSQTEATYAAFLTAPSTSAGSSRSGGSGSSSKSSGGSSGGNQILNNAVRGVSEGLGRALGNKLF